MSTTKLRELYPPIEPFNSGFLKVSDKHELYFEECGNKEGKPAVVLHGGPGGGSVPYYRQFFDPKVYRVVLFDQRGAGKSKPHACCEDNTTWDLVADTEKIREHLGIDKWLVFGGSWGACLSLAYAEKHKDRVKGLVLRGVFTLRRHELTWFYQEGASYVFPDAWEGFIAPVPEVERHDLISAYHRRLFCDDKATREKFATAWSVWEMATSRLYVDPEYIKRAADNIKFAVAFARIENHYFVNGGFFDYDGQLIKEATKLGDLPGTIVQGRYDMVCPMKSAWELCKVWKTADLKIIADSGHSAKEPGIISELVKATDKYRDL
mmetsp:Transcript_29616/g.32992  ORF Transcript_29616/g.32992 Transcript_29616/m.32992 type:complete len:322 (+) Transcript_29616:28-993(+)